nr:Plasmodium exported protein (PHISTa), unknown function [Plasmodium sp. DRC-Itaito]
MCNKLSSVSNMNKSELGNSNTKMKRKYRSRCVQYICLTICVIGMLYIKLRNEYEIHTASGMQNNNVYLRNLSELQKGNEHPSLRHINSPDNSKKNKVKNKGTDNNDKRKLGNNKGKQNDINKRKTNNVPTTVINRPLRAYYNNSCLRFTKQEMKHIIDSLQRIPPRKDLENIWNHALKTANNGTKKLGNQLKEYENEYGPCYEERPNSRGSYKRVLIKQPDEFNKRLQIHQNDYSDMFYELIYGKHTLDDIKNYIYSFLEDFENLTNLLFNKYKIKFEEKNMEIPKLETIYDTKEGDDKQEGKKEEVKEGGEEEEAKEGGEEEEAKEGGEEEEAKEGGEEEEAKEGGEKE